MIISRFASLVAEDSTLSEPAWWRFAGRWGIKIPDVADRQWDSGTHRIDDEGRSWASWHAHALVGLLVSEANGP